MSFDPTPGGVNANSYPTVQEFKDYWARWSSRTPTWIGTASDSLIEANLMAGTMMLDALVPWDGMATYDTQALAWPRTGLLSRNGRPLDSTVNPRELKLACCEYAGQLGSEDFLANDDAAINNIMSVRAGEVDVRFQREVKGTYEAADIQLRLQSPEFNFMSRELPDAVRRLLVPSWIIVPSIFRPFVFKVS